MEIDIGNVGSRFSRKRKRSFVVERPGRKRRRMMRTVIRKPLAPRRTGGFFGLNQGQHGIELKDIDTDISAVTINSTGAVTLINGVAQGTDFTQRVGRKFQMKSILIRMVAYFGSTSILPSVFRWMVVYDKQTNAAAPAVTDILDAATVTSNANLSNRERFVVIYDKIHVIGATAANDNSMKYIKKYKRIFMETTNGGTANTVGSIQTGGLFFVTVGDRVAGTTAGRFESGSIRIRFTDT